MFDEDDAKKKKQEYQRLYRESHRKERAEATRRWRERNPEYTRQYSEANRERIAEAARRWQKENPERIRNHHKADARRRWNEANPGKTSEAIRRWHKANPERVRAHERRRRARVAGVGGTHTEAQWQALCSYYMDQCLACGDVPDQLTRDHVVPITKGGSDDIENIQPLCKGCNSKKRTKTIDYR